MLKRFIKLLARVPIIELVGISTVMAGALTLLNAGGGGSLPPSWVASTCPTTSGQSPNICIDFINNRAWDGIASLSVTPASLLSVTNAAPSAYSTATQVASISANSAALGNAGLQIQGGATNLLLQSNTFTSSTWSKTGGTLAAPTVTANAATSPDGTTDASQTVFSTPAATSNWQYIYQTLTTTAGTLYTCSIWMQQAAGSPAIYLAAENVTTHAIVASPVVIPTSKWARYSVTFYATAASMQIYFGTNPTTTGAAPQVPVPLTVGGTINYFGAQCVTGPQPGAYVPTTTAAVTAAADSVTVIGDLKTALASSNGAVVIQTGDGYQSDPFRAELQATSTLLADGSNPVLAINGSNDVVAWASSALTSARSSTWTMSETVSLAWNGSTSDTLNLNGSPVTDSGNSRSIACSSACYLGSTGGSSNFLNGHIASLAVYPSAITPTVSQPVITSLNFNVPGITHYNPSTSTGTMGDTFDNTFDNGQLYSLANDTAVCDGISLNAAAGLYQWVTSGQTYWAPGSTSPANCVTTQTFDGGSYNLGGDGNTDSSDSYRMWKSWGLSGINQNLYEFISRQNYNTASNGYTNCTAYYGSGATCQANVQYAYYSTLITASLSGTSSSSPVTSSTSWTAGGGFPTVNVGPAPAPMFSDANLGIGCLASGGGSTGCGHYFSYPEMVKYGVDQSATATYGSGSTYVCAGGVSGGCPDGSGTYAYAVSNDGAWDVGNSLQLGRVPIASISSKNVSNWQVWDSSNASCSDTITDNNCWVAMSSMASATPILGMMQAMPTASGQYGNPSIQWLPAANEYVMTTWYYPSLAAGITFSSIQSMWQIWTASSLIGPWKLVQNVEWKAFCNGASGGYGTAGTQCSSTRGSFDIGSGFYSPAFVQGAMVNGTATDGGLTGAVLVSGSYNNLGTLYGPNWIPFAVNY